MVFDKKDYENRVVITEPIQNDREVSKLILGIMTEQLRNRSKTITGDNRTYFKSLLGKPHFYYRGEFYFHGWYMFTPEGIPALLILTAKDKGTCYERIVSYKGEKYPKNIQMDFIKQFLIGIGE